jgi:virulence plasmid B protein
MPSDRYVPHLVAGSRTAGHVRAVGSQGCNWLSRVRRHFLRFAVISLGLMLIEPGSTLAQPNQARPADASGVIDAWTPGTGVFNEGASPGTSVDPVTGVAHSAIPIVLPAARGDAQPVLTLVYSSNAGAQTAGVGWGLDIPSIERRPLIAPGAFFNRLTARQFDMRTADRYTFGGRPIVPLCAVVNGACGVFPNETMRAWAEGWTYYRAQVEGSFARIFRSPNDGNTWVVEQKNGVTMEFGDPMTEPKASGGTESVEFEVSCAPDCSSHFPRRWNLVRQYDTQRARTPGALGNVVNLVLYFWVRSAAGVHYIWARCSTHPPQEVI